MGRERRQGRRPGGCFADYYRWRDDVDAREMTAHNTCERLDVGLTARLPAKSLVVLELR